MLRVSLPDFFRLGFWKSGAFSVSHGHAGTWDATSHIVSVTLGEAFAARKPIEFNITGLHLPTSPLLESDERLRVVAARWRP
jgi:hypothetical protein